MAEEKVRLAQIAREAKNVSIGKQLKSLATQISQERGENYPFWGDTFMSILQNTDKIAYQVNKEAFHEVIDLLTAPSLETRALSYFNTLYEVASRLLTLDPFKALGIVKEFKRVAPYYTDYQRHMTSLNHLLFKLLRIGFIFFN